MSRSKGDGVTPSASVNDLTPQNGRTDMASVKPVEEASQDFTADLAAMRDDVAKLSSSVSEFIRTQTAETTNTVVDAVDNARQKISDTASKAQDRVARASTDYISYSAMSASVPRSFLSSGISVIVASVSRRTPATETAFSRAMRTTFVGSMIPASIRSTYSLRPASKPSSPVPVNMRATTTPASTAEFSAIWRVGASRARLRIWMPVFSSPSQLSSSSVTALMQRSNASPPPGTIHLPQ